MSVSNWCAAGRRGGNISRPCFVDGLEYARFLWHIVLPDSPRGRRPVASPAKIPKAARACMKRPLPNAEHLRASRGLLLVAFALLCSALAAPRAARAQDAAPQQKPATETAAPAPLGEVIDDDE